MIWTLEEGVKNFSVEEGTKDFWHLQDLILQVEAGLFRCESFLYEIQLVLMNYGQTMQVFYFV